MKRASNGAVAVATGAAVGGAGADREGDAVTGGAFDGAQAARAITESSAR